MPESRLRVEDGGPEQVRREAVITRGLLAVTLVASAFLAKELLRGLAEQLHAGAVGIAVEQLALIAIVVLLLYGNVVYQVTRLGFLVRRRLHQPVPRALLERVHDE